jgi:hypothetical protein
MIRENIKSGFRHCGIVPFDPDKILEDLRAEKEAQSTIQSAPELTYTMVWDNILALLE